MSILASELVLYNAVNRPIDDDSLAGGGIDLKMRPVFTQLSAAAKLTFQSTSPSDTQSVHIEGANAAGSTISEDRVLGGQTETASVNTYSKIHSIALASDAIGTITVRQGLGGTTIFTINVGERGGAALFLQSSSASGEVVRYDKVFWKNTNLSLDLVDAMHQLSADPDARIKVCVHASKNDSATLANRLATPAGSFVDDGVYQDIPGTVLEAGAAIGVWIQQDLPASDGAHDTDFSLRLKGSSL
jgi:hypothetical protein